MTDRETFTERRGVGSAVRNVKSLSTRVTHSVPLLGGGSEGGPDD